LNGVEHPGCAKIIITESPLDKRKKTLLVEDIGSVFVFDGWYKSDNTFISREESISVTISPEVLPSESEYE